MPKVEELALALKDQDMLTVLDTIIDPKVAPKADKTYVDAQDAKKQDVEAGKGLSTNDYTASEKTKLANMEGSHFKGIHKDLAALETAFPAASATVGGWAYLKDGANAETLAMLDGGAWVEQSNGGGATIPLTGAQIKALYEGNADTNVFTDGEKANLVTIFTRMMGIDFTPAVPTSPDENLKTDHIATSVPIRMEGDQKIPTDIHKAGLSKELMTIGNVVKMMDNLTAVTMMDKGTVANLSDITEVGIYEGTDVPDAPSQGKIMVMANKDTAGDYGFFVMDSFGDLHTGGKPNGATKITWDKTVNASDIGNIHALIAGHDLAYYLEQFQKQIGQLQHSAGQAKKDPISAGVIPVYSDVGFEYIDIPKFIGNPAVIPAEDIADGSPHFVSIDVEAGKTLNSNATWAWTKEQTPARMFTNIGKTKAVSPMELHAWIKTGSLVEIQKTGSDWFILSVVTPAVAHPTGTKALLDDGSVTLKTNYKPTNNMSILTKKYGDESYMQKLDADNPVLTMNVSGVGTSAQMEVFYDGYNVATMGWDKTTQDFLFTLADKADGSTKASFKIKQDGKAYIGGKEVATVDVVPTMPSGDGDYKLNIASGVATWVKIP